MQQIDAMLMSKLSVFYWSVLLLFLQFFGRLIGTPQAHCRLPVLPTLPARLA